ncbi:hypothetical protein U1Q18_046435, partial [Sarracenia purpurea var. burkii]
MASMLDMPIIHFVRRRQSVYLISWGPRCQVGLKGVVGLPCLLLPEMCALTLYGSFMPTWSLPPMRTPSLPMSEGRRSTWL